MSRKHGGSSGLEDLAFACVLCNRHKGADVASINPATGEAVRLFDPRRDRWTDHFRLEAGFIEALTSVGEATARVLHLNASERGR